MEKDRFDKFDHLVASCGKSLQRLRGTGMLQFGLTGAHTMCLRHLYGNPDGLTRTKLVRLCDIDKAQISRIINELCAKGYVIENDNENINYKKRLKLTPLGKDTTEEINRLVIELNEYVSSDISDEQLAVFYDIFEKISNRLKEAEDVLDQRVNGKE